MEERDKKGRFLKGSHRSIEERDKMSEVRRKYTLDQNYFEKINDPEKAYFFGFMFADGNISKDENKCSISQTKDKYILEKFQELLKTNRPLSWSKRDKKWILPFNSRKMKSDLIRKGCMPNKTFKVEFPLWLGEDLKVHFIRGFNDGDGSIGINKRDKHLHVSIGGRKDFLKHILNLSKITGHISRKDYESIWHLNYSGSFAVLFCNWIYKDATIYLKRKRNIFLDYLKYRKEYEEIKSKGGLKTKINWADLKYLGI